MRHNCFVQGGKKAAGQSNTFHKKMIQLLAKDHSYQTSNEKDFEASSGLGIIKIWLERAKLACLVLFSFSVFRFCFPEITYHLERLLISDNNPLF